MSAVTWAVAIVASFVSLLLCVVLSRQSRQTAATAKLIDERAARAEKITADLRDSAVSHPAIEPAKAAAEASAKVSVAAATASSDPYGVDPFDDYRKKGGGR